MPGEDGNGTVYHMIIHRAQPYGVVEFDDLGGRMRVTDAFQAWMIEHRFAIAIRPQINFVVIEFPDFTAAEAMKSRWDA